MSDHTHSMPPATFEFLVWTLRMQAETNLGLTPWTGEQNEVNLPLARHFIDILAVLQDKTKGNLTMDEQRGLENSVTELRFRYLQTFEEEKKKAAEAAEAPQAEPEPEPEPREPEPNA